MQRPLIRRLAALCLALVLLTMAGSGCRRRPQAVRVVKRAAAQQAAPAPGKTPEKTAQTPAEPAAGEPEKLPEDKAALLERTFLAPPAEPGTSGKAPAAEKTQPAAVPARPEAAAAPAELERPGQGERPETEPEPAEPEAEPAPAPPPATGPAAPAIGERPVASPGPVAVEVLDTDRMWLWEDFEAPGQWRVDSADDPARLTLDETEKTQGRRSLAVAYEFTRKGKVMVAKQTRLNLTGLRRFVLDVWSPADGLGFSLAFKTSAGNLWYESEMAVLKKGWNRDVSIDLSEKAFRLVSDTKTAPGFIQRLDDVRQVFLIVQRGRSDSLRDTAYIDNLRFYGTPVADWNLTEPRIISIYQPTNAVNQFGKFEVGVRIDGYFGNYFDSRDIAVDAVFAGPDDRTLTVPAFFAGFAEGTSGTEDNGPIWLVRFAPDRPGRWEYNIVAANRLGRRISETRRFDCRPSDAKGYIRVSVADPRYFERSTGELFFPIGQNVAWASDFEEYFKRQAETGQNWVRVWLCPWSLWLEDRRAGVMNLDVAGQIDHLLDLAERYGLHIQLCLEYHGMLNSSSWSKNPYNAERGGPCSSPPDFFTDSEARALFKQRLRYVAGRWGYSTHIFAWELFNEVDLTNFAADSDLYHWHREMSEYLKQADSGRHMVSTSFYNESYFSNIWRLGSIDFTQSHLYTEKIVRAAIDAYRRDLRFNKPWFISEFGRGASGETDAADREGVTLHSGLWAMAVLDPAGLAAPWWWDKHILPNRLDRMFKPVSAFLEGCDPRGKRYEIIDQVIFLSTGEPVNVLGRASNSEVLLWFYDRDRTVNTQNLRKTALIPAESTVALTNIVPGSYRLTFYDTRAGKEVGTSEVKAEGATLIVTLPRTPSDVAMKLTYLGDPRPRLVPTVNLGRRGE